MCLWCRRSLRFARHRTTSLIASLLSRCKRRVPVAPSVPSFACHRWGRSLLRFSCVANDVCLRRRRSLRFARRMTASLLASLLMRCKRRVPVAPSVPSLRSSQDGVAHCFASFAMHTACACGAVGPFASLVTGRRRSLLRFSHVANGVCLWRRRSLPSLVTDGVAHCFASRALQTTCACGAVGPFASLVA